MARRELAGSRGRAARRTPEPWHALTVRLGALVLRLWGIRVRASGLEHLPTGGAVVLASNHVSFPDFVVVQKAVLPVLPRVRFLCRANIFGVPVVGRLLHRMRQVPVDREAPAAAYLQARALLTAGETVGIFPEAGVSQAMTVRPLMRGAAALALETGAPLVPVATWGGQRIWPVGPGPSGRRRPPSLRRGRTIDVRVGARLEVRDGEDAADLTVRLGQTLSAMLDDLQALPEHQPAPGTHPTWHPAHLGGRAPTPEAAAVRTAPPRAAVAVSWTPRRPLDRAPRGEDGG